MRLKLLSLALVSVFALGGCAAGFSYASRPVANGLYVEESGPFFTTENPVGTKTGEACSRSILGIVVLGDSSIQTAAANGNINRIGTVNTKFKNILGIVADYCTVVTGE